MSTAAVEALVIGGDGEGQEGAVDAHGGEGDAEDVPEHGEDAKTAAAGPAAAGVGVSRTGLGQSMATFFQRGARARDDTLPHIHERHACLQSLCISRILHIIRQKDEKGAFLEPKKTNRQREFVVNANQLD